MVVMMRLVILALTIVLFLPAVVIAQDNTFNLEMLSPENIDRLVEIKRWAGSDRHVAATFSPNGKILALALNDGTVQLINPSTFEVEHVLTGAEPIEGDNVGNRLELIFNPDGSKILLYSRSGVTGLTYYLWNLTERAPLIVQHIGDYWAGVNRNLDIFWRAMPDDTIGIYHLLTGEEIMHTTIAAFPPNTELNADGSILITAGGSRDDKNDVYVWDTSTGALIQVLKPPEAEVNIGLTTTGINPDGTIWAGWQWWGGAEWNESKSVIHFYDGRSGKQFDTWDSEGSRVFRLRFSASGDVLAVEGQTGYLTDHVWIRDAQTYEPIVDTVVTGGGGTAFSPDSRLAVVSQGTSPMTMIFTLTEPVQGFRFEMYSYPETEFSPDGTLLLTTGADVSLWGVPADS